MHKARILNISLTGCVKASLGFDGSIRFDHPREVRSDGVAINQYTKKKNNLKQKSTKSTAVIVNCKRDYTLGAQFSGITIIYDDDELQNLLSSFNPRRVWSECVLITKQSACGGN